LHYYQHVCQSNWSLAIRYGCSLRADQSVRQDNRYPKRDDRTSLGDPISDAPRQVNDLSELANNPIGTSEVEDSGATGQVLSGTGNLLPAEIETKNLGASYGGKEGKHGKNLAGNSSAHHKKGELQDGEDLDLQPQQPYESDRRF